MKNNELRKMREELQEEVDRACFIAEMGAIDNIKEQFDDSFFDGIRSLILNELIPSVRRLYLLFPDTKSNNAGIETLEMLDEAVQKIDDYIGW